MKVLFEVDQQIVDLVKSSQGVYVLERTDVIEIYWIKKSNKKDNKYDVMLFEIGKLKHSIPCIKIDEIQPKEPRMKLSWFKTGKKSLFLPIFASQIMTTAAETVEKFNFIQDNQTYQLNLMSCVSGLACPSSESLNKTFSIIKNSVISFCNATATYGPISNANFSTRIVCQSLHWKNKLFTNNYTYQLQSSTNISSVILNCVKSQIQREQGCELPDWRTVFGVIGIMIFCIIVGCLLNDKKNKNKRNYSDNNEISFFKKTSHRNNQGNENIALLPSNVQSSKSKSAGCVIL